MVDVRFLLKFLDSGIFVKRVLVGLFIAIFPVFDLWFFFFLSGYVNFYILLAVIVGTSLLGLLLVLPIGLKMLSNIKSKIKYGAYPEREFESFAGLVFSAFLLLLPGFISFSFGLFLLIPVLSRLVGRIFTKALDSDLKEVYEYIKLYEIDV
ncbi:MAG: FxsA family protein [Spirochaetales bacterium]|nr:FxsA family protein [Spirochaetales bacterium]